MATDKHRNEEVHVTIGFTGATPALGARPGVGAGVGSGGSGGSRRGGCSPPAAHRSPRTLVSISFQ